MSQNKTFADKLNAFFFGQPVAGLSEQDVDTIHRLDRKLDQLLSRLESGPDDAAPLDEPGPALPEPASASPDQSTLTDLTEQVRKLAKTHFKANTLQEAQLAQQEKTVANLEKSVEQQEKRLDELAQQRQQAVVAAKLELIEMLLPALDSLDAAFNTGRRQVLKLSMPAETRQAVVAWLDGVRLARMRVLDILQAHDVAPIPTVGRPFDPNLHVAVSTDASGQAADGTILSEDRRGYAGPDKVLRFADVVVARSN